MCIAFIFQGADSETSLLIDRYRYMDLMPCSAFELKALGYKVSQTCINLFWDTFYFNIDYTYSDIYFYSW